ncbi:MAG TPA: 23S rRNA (adenine(2030)-N(6))-methyltransferase RlmJ [Alphaproteobacteria bacterium]|jgi:23S rRNA (adenine2030-N6)-methyltransferase
MNYRHVYHAGNFADVFKHIVLCRVVAHLAVKDAPLFLLDTHAGIGRYDLLSEEAQKTGEAAGGIRRLLADGEWPALLADYVAAVAALNEGNGPLAKRLRWYPGSPRFLRSLMRPPSMKGLGDRLAACELHPEDAKTLEREFARDRQAKIHAMDGYQALKAMVPPLERRGFVVVDPPFERRDEFAVLAKGLVAAHARWATGVYALWYPVKGRRPVDVFHGELAASGIRRILAAELMIHDGDDPERFNGCGLVLVNPPWKLAEELQEILPFLARVLRQGGEGAAAPLRWRSEWLVGE